MALINENDRHQIYLSRLTTGLIREHMNPALAESYKLTKAILGEAVDSTTDAQIKRAQKRIRDEVGELMDSGLEAFTRGLMDAAEYEAGYSAELFGASTAAAETLKVPSREKIENKIRRSLMTLNSGARVDSGVWAKHLEKNRGAVTRAIEGIVGRGMQSGQTVGQMAKQIKKQINGVLANNANALARTGQSHFQAMAREAVAEANRDVLKYRVFTATFDYATTDQCRRNHGKSWAMDDDGYPRLPLHWGERSVYVYVERVEDAFEGERAATGGVKGSKLAKGRKAEYNGKADQDVFDTSQIDASITQDEWLRSQPAWYQNAALNGKARGKLFRDGKMKIEQFSDISGRPLRLDELRELDSEAFKRAGL